MVHIVLFYASVLWKMKRHTVPKKSTRNFCGLIISQEEFKNLLYSMRRNLLCSFPLTLDKKH